MKEEALDSSHWEQAFSKRITRRRLLQGALAGSVGLAVAALVGCNVEKDTKSRDIVRKVKAYEEGLGDRYLTFEEARDFVPLVAQLFSENTGSWQNPEDITNHTFLIWQKPPAISNVDLETTDISEVFASDWFRQLKDDYPNLVLTEEVVRDILTVFWYRSTSAWIQENNIFILNYQHREELAKALTNGFLPQQYQEMAPKTNCFPTTPAVWLRSSLLHEMSHRDTIREPKPLESEVLESFEKQLERTKGRITHGEKHGFWIDLISEKGTKIPFRGLEEFFAMYMEVKISVNSGLTYSIGPGPTPLDIYNFGLILQQAEIGDDELLTLHREANVREFLLRIRKAAKNRNANSERNALDFGAWVATNVGAWEDIKPYFPKLDTNSYAYYEIPKSGEESGCIH